MPTLTEGKLIFAFPENWKVTKLDEWSYYRSQFSKLCPGLQSTCSNCNANMHCKECGASKTVGIKAVDFLAIDSQRTTWLIEVKDYREHSRTKVLEIGSEIALKVRDSLSIIAAASLNANDATEKSLASESLKSTHFRIVLHLEQKKTNAKLFPQAIVRADLVQKLKQLLKSVDPHPKVVATGSLIPVPWDVSSQTGMIDS
jgi:hypothetical protein